MRHALKMKYQMAVAAGTLSPNQIMSTESTIVSLNNETSE